MHLNDNLNIKLLIRYFEYWCILTCLPGHSVMLVWRSESWGKPGNQGAGN